MRDLCFSSASASVSSWPLVVGSLNSGALSPTCSTDRSLSALEDVPPDAGHAGDAVARRESRGDGVAKGQPPCAREGGIGTAEGDDVLWHLAGHAGRRR